MSEYQYYEWQAVDRPLTEEEMEEVSSLSSHMDLVTATQAIVTYQWGDFKHDPVEVLLRYFDGMLYWANWGSRALALRFPKGTIDVERVQAYWVDEWLTLREQGDYHVLHFDLGNLEPGDWYEEPNLGPLLALRQQIVEGDYRALYLAWLKAAEEGLNVLEEDPEPPVPAGLAELNAGLLAFADTFLELNPWLPDVAAAASAPLQPAADEALAAALAQLPLEEGQDYLRRLLRNEPQVRSSLRKRLAGIAGVPSAPAPGGRTAGQLLAEADRLELEEERRQSEAAERKRRQELEELAGREDAVWREVEELLGRTQPKAYRQVVALLKRLQELAVFQDRLQEFEGRMAEIRARYGRRHTLMKQLERAGLLIADSR